MALKDIKVGDVISYKGQYEYNHSLFEVQSIELNNNVVVLRLQDDPKDIPLIIHLTPANMRRIKSPLAHELNAWKMKKLKE